MPYRSISQLVKGDRGGRSQAATTLFANLTEDLKDLPQMMNAQQALNIANYLVTYDGGLEKRKGLTGLFSVAGTNGITMLEKFTSDLYMYAYGTNVAVYQKSTDTKTVIKSNFTNSDPYSGQTYGDYFFICNGGDPIGRISRTLAYDGQTGNFTVGLKVTGGTSGATGIVLQDADAGATGTLTLGQVTGVFVDNELITDTSVGSATANGALAWTYTATSGPKAKILRVVGPRLYAGNLSTDPTAVAYSDSDTGTNPPFATWTVGANANDPGLVNYRNAGPVNAINSLGTSIIVLADNGKWAFSPQPIDQGGTLKKIDEFVTQLPDMGGARASIVTPGGLFYANEGGLWQLQSLGQSNIAFSQQEGKPSILLGVKYFDNVNLTNADLAYDAKTDTLFLTCAKNSDVNNFVIAYNVGTKTFSHFTGWTINRFMNDNQTIYGSGSTNNKVWTCFDGYADDGVDIWTDYLQELQTGNLETRKMLLGVYAAAYLSTSTELVVAFDIYDVVGVRVPNKIRLEMTAEGSGGNGAEGYGNASYGAAGFGGSGIEPLNQSLVECFAGYRPYIRNYQRVRVHITAHDQVPHNLTWVKIDTREKVSIRRRNLVQLSS